jgi:hypothetical protein
MAGTSGQTETSDAEHLAPAVHEDCLSGHPRDTEVAQRIVKTKLRCGRSLAALRKAIQLAFGMQATVPNR